MAADALSSSLSVPRYRIQALEGTLQILQEKHNKLQNNLKASGRESAVEKGSVTDEPKTKERPKRVSFVNWDEQEKMRKEAIQARLEKLRQDMEVAKSEGHEAETEHLRVRSRQVMDSSTSNKQDEGEDKGEDEAEDEGEDKGGNEDEDEGEHDGEYDNEDELEGDSDESVYEDGGEGEGEDEDEDELMGETC